MTLTCSACDSYDIELVDDNGAEFPETRVEWYDCRGCGHNFKKVLSA